MGNCLYLYNGENYIKNLAKNDNSKNFQHFYEQTSKKLKGNFAIIFVLLLLLSFLIYKINFHSFIIGPIILFFISYIYVCFSSLSYCKESYDKFIALCGIILKFETITKSTYKVTLYNKNIGTYCTKILNDLNTNIELIIKSGKPSNCENKIKQEEFEQYLANKGAIFIKIINDFQFLFCESKSFIEIFISCSLVNFLLSITTVYSRGIESMLNAQIEWDKVSFSHLASNKEKQSIYNIKRIYEMISNNLESNKDYLKLIELIESKKENEKNKEIEVLIDEIINKKRISIASFEKIKEELIKEHQNTNEECNIQENQKEIIMEENKKDTSVSLLELELGENFCSEKEEKKEEKKENTFTRINPLDIIKGEREVKELKENFIMQLEEYYFNLKKSKSD